MSAHSLNSIWLQKNNSPFFTILFLIGIVTDVQVNSYSPYCYNCYS